MSMTHLWELRVSFVDGMGGGIDGMGKLLFQETVCFRCFTDPEYNTTEEDRVGDHKENHEHSRTL